MFFAKISNMNTLPKINISSNSSKTNLSTDDISLKNLYSSQPLKNSQTASINLLDVNKFRLLSAKDFNNQNLPQNNCYNAWAGGMEHKGISRKIKSSDVQLLKLIQNWNEMDFPMYFKPINTFVEASADITNNIISQITNKKNHKKNKVDYYNAEDFILQCGYHRPARHNVKKILEIGPGYGRQINLWSKEENLVFCALEAIESQYLSQNLYYSLLENINFYEYFNNPENFEIKNNPGIYHLPTWRLDLLPKNFFDLVIAVQVLPELEENLMLKMLKTFQKCVKPGGAIYIRDHDLAWIPGHKFDLEKILPDFGFQLEFRPIVIDGVDIHGTPRIFRKPENKFRPLDEKVDINELITKLRCV